MSKCPTCASPQPHLHPAVQHGGEVELCTDEFHLTPTNQNTADRISSVNVKRREKALAEAFDRDGTDLVSSFGGK